MTTNNNNNTSSVEKSNELVKAVVDFFGKIGALYTFGGVGGCVSHFFKAFREAPNGQRRFISGIQGAYLNAPRAATKFVLWTGAVHKSGEYALKVLREEDDQLNYIISAAATGMLYKMRQGFAPVFQMGILCVAIAHIITNHA